MKQKILIIDDDKDLCRLLRNNLEQEGYYVCVCHDGITGLKEAKSSDYQLVVLDIMLPLKNGYEVLREIREDSFVPILMLTAKDSEGDKVSGLRMGADDYLTKPFAGFYPWTITYLLQTGRLEQSGCPPIIGISIIIFVCMFGICISILRFQKEDI